VIGSVVAGLLVAAYAAAFRNFGFFHLAEEGLLLAQAARVAAGQVPYVDFHTGYGPLYFRLQALLVTAGGMAGARWALIVLAGASAGLVHALTRRLAGGASAAVAVALEVAFFLPVAPTQGAPFLVPYPAWYTAVAALALPLVLGRGGVRRAGLAGVVAGLAAGMKVNGGLLLAAGAAAAIVLDGPACGRAGRAVLGLIAVAAIGLVAPTGVTVTALVLVPPVLALAALGRERGAPDTESLPRLGALAAGFLLVAVPCYARPFLVLGPTRFVHEALHVGSGVAEVYAVSFPSTALLGVAVGFAALVVPATRAVGRALAIAGVVAVGASTVVAATTGEGPSGALRLAGEGAAFGAVPLVLWSSLMMLRWRSALLVPLAIASTAALQLYPRPDFEHLSQVAPVLLPLALTVWGRVTRRVWGPARLGLPMLAAGGRFLPTAVVLAHLVSGELTVVDVGASHLAIEPAGAPRLRALGNAVQVVAQRTKPGDVVLAFPACAAVPFFAGRLPAGPHDYFYPGRPDRAEAAALAARFEAAPPLIAVTCTTAGTDLARAWDYYPELVALVRDRYRPILHIPEFSVRERTP
jgi:hypothetical protein